MLISQNRVHLCISSSAIRSQQGRIYTLCESIKQRISRSYHIWYRVLYAVLRHTCGCAYVICNVHGWTRGYAGARTGSKAFDCTPHHTLDHDQMIRTTRRVSLQLTAERISALLVYATFIGFLLTFA